MAFFLAGAGFFFQLSSLMRFAAPTFMGRSPVSLFSIGLLAFAGPLFSTGLLLNIDLQAIIGLLKSVGSQLTDGLLNSSDSLIWRGLLKDTGSAFTFRITPNI